MKAANEVTDETCMSPPRPVVPRSSTPATSDAKRMQRVQWMQRVMIVLISGPTFLSSTALFNAAENKQINTPSDVSIHEKSVLYDEAFQADLRQFIYRSSSEQNWIKPCKKKLSGKGKTGLVCLTRAREMVETSKNPKLNHRFPVKLMSVNRLRSLPKAIDWSCRSHSPPWSQMGQSRGWLTNRNSMTPSRALRVMSELVLMRQP